MATVRSYGWKRVVLYVVIAVFVVLYLVPVYMTVVTALKEPANINLATAWQLPSPVYWKSFAVSWGKLNQNVLNSVVLAVVGTALSAFLGSINGYVLSKWKFRSSEIVFSFVLFGMFIPYQIILIPLFKTLKFLHLYGGIPGLIVAHTVYGIPITTLIFRNYYAQISNAIMDSARIDGAGFFRIYLYIFLALSPSGFVVVGIWQFTQIWNEFLWGITLTQAASNPITVGLAQLAGGQAVTWNQPMAGSIIAAIPVLLIYIFLGQFFIRGLLAGSVKE